MYSYSEFNQNQSLDGIKQRTIKYYHNQISSNAIIVCTHQPTNQSTNQLVERQTYSHNFCHNSLPTFSNSILYYKIPCSSKIRLMISILKISFKECAWFLLQKAPSNPPIYVSIYLILNILPNLFLLSNQPSIQWFIHTQFFQNYLANHPIIEYICFQRSENKRINRGDVCERMGFFNRI